ncbi:hypothetical protein ET989_11730 [Propioniciclava sinopodophylli]|uniref:Uncharacterized protein n=1 Tax=Propioniciclava sinopodophylli TaxID=1837344 RepID=A0A4Q9KDC5_9ACTN|nr:hypothetical protein [Propioniciclava sinopodophylli]TBT83351.1 hypothetical protein ET989_11730 [Propioniciclava sinopodophylli]
MNPDQTDTFADVLTAAIQARGLSLERIRARLDAADVPVSIATLSYWQSGRSLPTRSRSYHTLVELEKILNLEPGHLTQHTHTADGRTRRELFEWQNVVPSRDLATQIIDDLGIDMQGQLTRVTMHDLLEVDADRSETSLTVRVVWRTERQGLHRWAVVNESDMETEEGQSIEPLFGCALGEVVEVPERQLLVAEMLAPRAMQRGELFTSDYRLTFGRTSIPSFRMLRAVSDPVRALSLAVRFSPSALPTRVRAGVQPGLEDAEPSETVPVPLARNEAQFVWADAKPGVYSLHWDWD